MGNLKVFGTTWTDANGHLMPAALQLINTNNTKSINRNSYYSGGTWHTTYSLNSSYVTSDTLKYFPSSTSQQLVKILIPRSINPMFFYGTVSGTILTPQGDCTFTSEIVDDKAWYTITIPANKVCFITKIFQSSGGATSSNYFCEGFVPDEIGVDWNIKDVHKFNGTSWD